MVENLCYVLNLLTVESYGPVQWALAEIEFDNWNLKRQNLAAAHTYDCWKMNLAVHQFAAPSGQQLPESLVANYEAH
jgi:hypothetical protein